MNIKWKLQARASLRQIVYYIKTKFDNNAVNKFRCAVEQQLKVLESFPDIGAPDPLFYDRATTYRSVLINRLSKMVYFVDYDNNTIVISAFWDCRQDPTNQASQVSES
ncbi:MAG: type II toxin-antitoxin system RelE/ParE family toxin [Bacteroidales bacterium]|nr:type II toxin-antitoxin system RelE/ParE family toxin [Bacteroidales bacterium]